MFYFSFIEINSFCLIHFLECNWNLTAEILFNLELTPTDPAPYCGIITPSLKYCDIYCGIVTPSLGWLHTCSTICSLISNIYFIWVRAVDSFISGFEDQCCAPSDLWMSVCLFQLLVNAIFPTLKWLEARIFLKREYILWHFSLFILNICTLECNIFPNGETVLFYSVSLLKALNYIWKHENKQV